MPDRTNPPMSAATKRRMTFTRFCEGDRCGYQPRKAITTAEQAGLMDVGVDVRFLHPPVRSVVYPAAVPEERRAVHQPLARGGVAARPASVETRP